MEEALRERDAAEAEGNPAGGVGAKRAHSAGHPGHGPRRPLNPSALPWTALPDYPI